MGDNADSSSKSAFMNAPSERSSSKEKRRIRRDSAKEKSAAVDINQNNANSVANGGTKRGGKIGDRKSRSIYGRGLPKKQGGGGKGTWGRPGEELYSERAIDNKDPNYDSEELDSDIMYKPVVPEWNKDEIVKTLKPMLREYFEHGQQDEVFESLKGINISDRKYMVPVVLITLSMEMKNEFREMASALLKRLFQPLPPKEAGDATTGVVQGVYFASTDDLQHAILELCNDLPDLTLDTPDATKVLGRFIARAISDNILDRIILIMISDAAALNDDEYGTVSAREARLLLSIPHYNLSHIWGVGGGNQPMTVLKAKINLLLKEYLSSGDSEEAIRCIQDLDVPHFNHEVVYEAVIMVIELSDDRSANMMVHLFKRLSDTAVVSTDQLSHGFKRVYGEMTDLSIDVPNAYSQLRNFVQKCYDLKVINSRLMMSVPNKSRKRFVSEGDRRHYMGGRVDKFFDLA